MKHSLQHGLGIVRVEERLELREYDERLGDDYLTVWVNLDVDMADRWNAYKDREAKLIDLMNKAGDNPSDELSERLMVMVREIEEAAVPFYADMWDMPVEDASALYRANHILFAWCAKRSWEKINDYREQRPKASGGT